MVSIKLYLSYEFFSYDRHDRYNDMETWLKNERPKVKKIQLNKVTLFRTMWELTNAPFLSHGRQPEVSCFPFNIFHIYLVKYLFTSSDD